MIWWLGYGSLGHVRGGSATDMEAFVWEVDKLSGRGHGRISLLSSVIR